MKTTNIIIWSACLVTSLLITIRAQAQIHTVQVNCVNVNDECIELLNPDPIHILVGEQVDWMFAESCVEFPCSGACEINVPAGDGFPGFFDFVIVPGLSNPTPPFNSPGVFPYRLECSPPIVGTIIVGSPSFPLFITGPCPGKMTATTNNSTPLGPVFFIYAFASGSKSVPGCPGLDVDLKRPKIAGSAKADANGDASIGGYVPPAACGRVIVQAVDTSACTTSNTYKIP